MAESAARFRKIVLVHYKKYGRHDLPWRRTKDVYKILVSEVMLQQTQVERVIPFYKKFIKQFPTAKKLATAPLSQVLKEWQGLGYNRRAKMLHQAVKELAVRNIKTVSELETLPGVGPYTARAVAAFAYNQDVIFVETNIRTAIIHHFFNRNTTIYRSVSDARIQEILVKLLPKGKAREWYSALMDYGAFLKKSGVKVNQKSKTYTKQSKFSGSLREARGAILRELARETATRSNLIAEIEHKFDKQRRTQILRALDDLFIEGLIQKSGSRYTLAS